MWGPGVVVHVINILPFAFFICAPFLYKRGNIFSINPFGNSRTYYRNWYVRVFFGRFQYTIYAFAGVLLAKHYTYDRAQIKKQLDHFTGFSEDFDETKNPEGEIALYSHLYQSKYKSHRDALLEYRAQRDHDLKIEAFDKYEAENLDELKEYL